MRRTAGNTTTTIGAADIHQYVFRDHIGHRHGAAGGIGSSSTSRRYVEDKEEEQTALRYMEEWVLDFLVLLYEPFFWLFRLVGWTVVSIFDRIMNYRANYGKPEDGGGDTELQQLQQAALAALAGSGATTAHPNGHAAPQAEVVPFLPYAQEVAAIPVGNHTVDGVATPRVSVDSMSTLSNSDLRPLTKIVSADTTTGIINDNTGLPTTTSTVAAAAAAVTANGTDHVEFEMVFNPNAATSLEQASAKKKRSRLSSSSDEEEEEEEDDDIDSMAEGKRRKKQRRSRSSRSTKHRKGSSERKRKRKATTAEPSSSRSRIGIKTSSGSRRRRSSSKRRRQRRRTNMEYYDDDSENYDGSRDESSSEDDNDDESVSTINGIGRKNKHNDNSGSGAEDSSYKKNKKLYTELPQDEIDLPPAYREKVLQVGYCEWNRKTLPCIIVSPFDFEKDSSMHKTWFTMARKHLKKYKRLDGHHKDGEDGGAATYISLDLMVFWYIDRTYSIVPANKFIPYEVGKHKYWKELPSSIQRKQQQEKALNRNETMIVEGLEEFKQQVALPSHERTHPDKVVGVVDGTPNNKEPVEKATRHNRAAKQLQGRLNDYEYENTPK